MPDGGIEVRPYRDLGVLKDLGIKPISWGMFYGLDIVQGHLPRRPSFQVLPNHREVREKLVGEQTALALACEAGRATLPRPRSSAPQGWPCGAGLTGGGAGKTPLDLLPPRGRASAPGSLRSPLCPRPEPTMFSPQICLSLKVVYFLCVCMLLSVSAPGRKHREPLLWP